MRTIAFTLALCAVAATAPHAQTPDAELDDLSLEQLLDVEVFVASKRPTHAYETPAAISVLTREDLRRNGATTLVEALEWVPGVQFSRLNASNTAVGVRGFTGVLSDKLLVLIDGRSIYSLFYSGVYWDEHDLPLEDIERIEIIRGPGGTLWGANAVNGVINVVTRHSADTEGVHATTHLGAEETGVKARFGGTLGEKATGRVWITAQDREAYATAPEHYEGGGWQNVSGGTRIDAQDVAGGDLLFTLNAVSVETEREDLLYDPVTHEDSIAEPAPHSTRAGAALVRWQRDVGTASGLALQSWFEIHDRDERVFGEFRTSYDLDAQFTHEGGRHTLVTGANLRVSRDRIDGSGTYSFVPDRRTLTWSSVFAQDEVRLGDRLRVIGGVKFEHNDFSGWEWQPNLRTAVDAGRAGFFWAAASRAVRTPSRAYTSTVAMRQIHGAQISGLPLVARFDGRSELESESLLAFELGWRKLFSRSVSLDVTAFQNDYDDLIYARARAPRLEGGTTPNPFFEVPTEILNGAEIRARGVEATLGLQPFDVLEIHASYSWLDLETLAAPYDAAQGDLGAGFLTNNDEDSPTHTGFVRLRATPAPDWDVDLGLRLTSDPADVPLTDPITRPAIDATRELSARIAWRPHLGTEVALIGRNLLDDGRVDFYDRTDIYPSGEIPTRIFLQLSIDR